MLALRGMSRLLSRTDAPDIICEISEPLLARMGSSGSEVRVYMKNMSYEMYRPVGGRLEIVRDTQEESEGSLGENYIFSKKPLAEQKSLRVPSFTGE